MSYIKEMKDSLAAIPNNNRFVPSAKYRAPGVLFTRTKQGTFDKGDTLKIIQFENTPDPKCINQNGRIGYSNYFKMLPFIGVKA